MNTWQTTTSLIFICELIYYLVADGCKIKTPVFNLSIRLPGEYEGSETSLPEDVHPEARLQEFAGLCP